MPAGGVFERVLKRVRFDGRQQSWEPAAKSPRRFVHALECRPAWLEEFCFSPFSWTLANGHIFPNTWTLGAGGQVGQEAARGEPGPPAQAAGRAGCCERTWQAPCVSAAMKPNVVVTYTVH